MITTSALSLVIGMNLLSIGGALGSAGLGTELPLNLPKDWKSEMQEGVRIIKPGDLREGKVFTVMVPPLTKKVGSLEGLMKEAKSVMAEVGKFEALAEPARGKTFGGWDFELLVGSVAVGDARILGQLIALRKSDAEEGVMLVIAESAETMQNYGDDLAAMIRSVGDGSPTPGGKAAVADLQYTLPPGWETKPVDNCVMLEKWENKGDQFGLQRLFRLLICPSEPLTDSIRDLFLAKWNADIRSTYKSEIVPMPMMRRLKSGLACAFDGDDQSTTKEGTKVYCNLYLLIQGDRVVPVVGGYVGGISGSLEQDLVALFESARIPGAKDKPITLFDPQKFAGDWTTSSSAIATYVTNSGGYAGDATVASGSAFTLRRDGSFESWIGGVGRGMIVRESDRGKWRIEDTSLVLDGASKRAYRIYGIGSDSKVGSFLVLSQFSGTDETVDFSYPRRPLWGMWLKLKG